jgi:hypothetical protein
MARGDAGHDGDVVGGVRLAIDAVRSESQADRSSVGTARSIAAANGSKESNSATAWLRYPGSNLSNV